MNDNKLIAEFMGVHDEISLDSIAGNIHSWSDAPFFYITEDSKEKVIEGVAKYSKYHTSWDWLWPVLIKCKESVDYCSDDNALKYHNIEDEMLSQLSIEDTYNAVVEFIKEHNDDTI